MDSLTFDINENRWSKVALVKPDDLDAKLEEGWFPISWISQGKDAHWILGKPRGRGAEPVKKTEKEDFSGEPAWDPKKKRVTAGGKDKEASPHIRPEDLPYLPVLKLADYEDPINTIKAVQDPRTLLDMLQVLVVELATPKDDDTDEDLTLRRVGAHVGGVLANILMGAQAKDTDEKADTGRLVEQPVEPKSKTLGTEVAASIQAKLDDASHLPQGQRPKEVTADDEDVSVSRGSDSGPVQPD